MIQRVIYWLGLRVCLCRLTAMERRGWILLFLMAVSKRCSSGDVLGGKVLEIRADRTGALPGSFVSTAAVSTVIVGALGRLAAGSESILETLSENYFSNIELMMREERERRGEKPRLSRYPCSA